MLINYDRDKYLSEFSHKTLQDRYLVNGEMKKVEMQDTESLHKQMLILLEM